MATLQLGNLLTLNQQSLEGALEWNNSANGTVLISTTHAYDDTHSLQLTATASGSAQFTTGTGARSITTGIVVGDTFTASARVYSTTSRTIRALVNYYNGVSFISQQNVIIGTSTAGSFTKLSSSVYVPPVNTTRIELIFIAAANVAAEQHWFDELYFGRPNQAPVASAGGDQVVQPSDVVSLSGSATDPENNTPFTYQWATDASYAGPAITFANATAASTTFTAPATPTDYRIPINLTVQDSGGASGTDQLVVTVGQITLLEGNLLTLNQQTLEGALAWNNSTNGTVALSATHAQQGVWGLRLTANADGAAQFTTGVGGGSITSGIVVGQENTVETQIYSSVARSIRALVNYYNGVTVVQQTNNVIGTSQAGAFKHLSFELGAVPATTDRIEVNFLVAAALAGEQHWFDQIYYGYKNQAPVVSLGLDIATAPGQEVTLTANVTDEENDTPFSYQWEVDGSYSGPTISLATPTAASTSFTPPAQLDSYQIPVNVTVTDAAGQEATEQIVVTVYAGPWVWYNDGGVWTRRKLYRRVDGDWLWP